MHFMLVSMGIATLSAIRIVTLEFLWYRRYEAGKKSHDGYEE